MLSAGDGGSCGSSVIVSFNLPNGLGQQLGYAVAAVNAFDPSPPPPLPGVALPSLGSPTPPQVLNAFADRYCIDRPSIFPDAKATWKSISQRFVPALRSHFDRKAAEIETAEDLRKHGFSDNCDNIWAQAVESGLLTFEKARYVKHVMAVIGKDMRSEGIGIYRRAAEWFTPGKVISRFLNYTLLGVVAFHGIARMTGAKEPSWPLILGAIGVAAVAGIATEVGGNIFHRRCVEDPPWDRLNDAALWLKRAERALSVPYKPLNAAPAEAATKPSDAGDGQG